MAGISRHTGQVISNLESAYQGVEVILTTRIGERWFRREFGGGIVELLGRAITPSLFVAWQQLIGTAIDLWEPRFKVRAISVDASSDAIRRGEVKLSIAADWRPNAHYAKDDSRYSTAVDGTVNFGVGISSGSVKVGLQL